ncbi:hypothetical protein MYAM1_000286 [Malassezia yamatoensis]|uniref:ferric-chelate reductase (NADPH) n=1 Tax=Malassezia yamatoensis TaxID=253288 RepID=A0AAJ6CH88_9BASI|nr:hypothetical protein MYAM1_000286 [Malassezia yamatoensis]
MDDSGAWTRLIDQRGTAGNGITTMEQQGLQYLSAHQFTKPSQRYMFIFWFILAGIAVLMGFQHMIGLMDRTFVGTVWIKCATSNHVARLFKAPRTTPAQGAMPQARSFVSRIMQAFQRRAFLSFNAGRLLAMVAILLPFLCLTFIGYDYIDSRRGMFAMDGSSMSQTQAQKRSVQWGIGTNSPVLFDKPEGSLPYHTWWTVGSRFGDLANALTPLVVLFALKQAPFALLSLPIFGAYSLDSLGFLHKWAGVLLWVYATVHTVTWLVQVGKDNQRVSHLWSMLFSVPRFRWAICAYIFLSLLVATSITPIRRNYYEFFYVSHVVCILGFMISTWAHHPRLGWWMLAALVLWGGERIMRIVRVMWINYSDRPSLLREAKHTPIPTQADEEQSNSMAMHSNDSRFASQADLAYSSENRAPLYGYAGQNLTASQLDLGLDGYPKNHMWINASDSVLRLPDLNKNPLQADQSDPGSMTLAQATSGNSHLREPILQPSQDGFLAAINSNSARGTPTPSSFTPRRPGTPARNGQAGTEAKRNYSGAPDAGISMAMAAPFRPVISHDLRLQLFPGYAFIQPLAGHMMRLVLRTASPLKWRPGQWVYLQLPRLSWFQSHPFTIASAFTKPKRRLGGHISGPDDDVDQLIMLLIRVRGGLTRRLWNLVQEESQRSDATTGTIAQPSAFPTLGKNNIPSQVHGVYLRAIVDGPYGSSGRIDWGAYQSAVIICGGSGVSYGISVLDHLCRDIARVLRGEDVRGKFGRAFHLRRICFVWIMREFAHLQWAASAIRLCLEMLPPSHLNVQMYVTHVNQKEVVKPVNPQTPFGSPSMSVQSHTDGLPYHAVSSGSGAHETSNNPMSHIIEDNHLDPMALGTDDLTQFDQEHDEPLTEMDRIINEHIMREGKLRRAKSRKRSVRRRQRPLPVSRIAETSDFATQHADYQATSELNGEYVRDFAQDNFVERLINAPGSLMAFTEQAFNPARSEALPLSAAQGSNTPNELRNGSFTPDIGRVMSPAPMVVSGQSSSPSGLASSPNHPQDYFSVQHHSSPPVSNDTYPPPPPSSMPGPYLNVDSSHSEPNPLIANLDASEISDFDVVAELTRAGYPKLDQILAREMDKSMGRTMTACCGPEGLLAVVRAIVAKHISIHRVRHGDWRGHASLYGESYET